MIFGTIRSLIVKNSNEDPLIYLIITRNDYNK